MVAAVVGRCSGAYELGATGSLAFIMGESPRLLGSQRETFVNIALVALSASSSQWHSLRGARDSAA